MKFLQKYKNKLIIGGLVLLAVFIGINRLRTLKYQNPSVFNPQKDTVVQPETKDISLNLTLAGSVSASEIASLHFQNPGKLVWVGVKVGDRVKKYQAIASLDKEQLKKSPFL